MRRGTQRNFSAGVLAALNCCPLENTPAHFHSLTSLINCGTYHRGLQHRFIECCSGGRANQLVSPKFFGLPGATILVKNHPNMVTVPLLREIAHLSMIGVFPLRAGVAGSPPRLLHYVRIAETIYPFSVLSLASHQEALCN